jgi:hypothetical protein
MARRVGISIVLALLAVNCGGGTSPAPTSPTANASGTAAAASYLSAVVQTMRDNSINRLTIDWTSFTNQVTQRGAGAQTIVDTYPAISLALGLLNDHHSYFVPPAGVTARPTNASAYNCTTSAVPNAAVPDDVGYVRIGAFSDATPGADVAFANAIQAQIRGADRSGLVGWIVDLRGNGGGNMWPMVAGVGSVLGEGVLGFFVDPTGATSTWTYQNGVAANGGVPNSHVTASYVLLHPAPRVAVLTDRGVASSGEAVTVAFRGRPQTRSFGSATCGLSTSIRGFTLSDGAVLGLNTSVDADRNRVSYGDVIQPDEGVAGDGEVVQRAIAW